MSKYYYTEIKNGYIKLPQELLDRMGVEENDTVEIVKIGDTDIQISFVEEFYCPYGHKETQESCYKCGCFDICTRTERVKRNNKL